MTLFEAERPEDKVVYNHSSNAGQIFKMALSQYETAGKGDRL